MRVKCGRYEYDLIHTDLIMNNDKVILILGRVTLNCNALKMSKATFNKLLKNNDLEFVIETDGAKYYKLKEAIK